MTRILHIDDNEAIRLLYEDELTEEGYEVIGVSSCEDIFDRIARIRPDIIVFEPGIPEVDGLEILQMIRNSNYNMPVIISTSCPEIKYDQRCLAADYVLIKSYNLSELKLKIEMVIDGRRVFQDEPIRKSLQELQAVP